VKSISPACDGPFTARSLSDNMIYMEYSGSSNEKDLKDEGTKVYISDFFNPTGSCSW